MPLQLTTEQARVLGCLMEKAVTTPDQYPLTLNALVSACNQKSSRDPVMNLEQGQVQRITNQLEEMHLVVKDENFRSQVQKISQRFCGTPFSEYEFDSAQYAVVCLLLLRGAQTPGEVRSRSGRLHSFDDNEDARNTLNSLIDREGGAVLARLPKRPGRQDNEYVHLFSGEPTALEKGELEKSTVVKSSVAEEVALPPVATRTSGHTGSASTSAWQTGADLRIAELERRVVILEAELNSLRQELGG
jgi:uncharacterized protein YceH (UPF0502 family)